MVGEDAPDLAGVVCWDIAICLCWVKLNDVLRRLFLAVGLGSLFRCGLLT